MNEHTLAEELDDSAAQNATSLLSGKTTPGHCSDVRAFASCYNYIDRFLGRLREDDGIGGYVDRFHFATAMMIAVMIPSLMVFSPAAGELAIASAK